ncbi:hypothetical protein SBRCBS47491_006063 [Sporothrix bragantina]|uniref:Helicase C-terminal domain-containing protein n=1 Tax=Sporothrix bragantina TaxID=671064 RepID=A0ABP0C1T8_9PEZI
MADTQAADTSQQTIQSTTMGIPTFASTQEENFPVILDPFWTAVSSEEMTHHITGDDDGERLMNALAEACQSSSSSSDTTAPKDPSNTTTPPTLADVPFQFLRVEVNEQGAPKWPGLNPFANTLGQHGILAKYFADSAPDADPSQSLWHYEHHPPTFRHDFPYSVDNFDCERLVEDLEDDNDLLDRDVTSWALWVGLSQNSTSKKPAFASRTRIFLAEQLLDILHLVHLHLKSTAEPLSIPTMYFIVAVSYKGRYRSSDVTEPGSMMLAAPLYSTLTFFTSKMQKLDQLGQESIASSSLDDDESIPDDTSSIGNYEGGAVYVDKYAISNSPDASENGGARIGYFPYNPIAPWVVRRRPDCDSRYYPWEFTLERELELREQYRNFGRSLSSRSSSRGSLRGRQAGRVTTSTTSNDTSAVLETPGSSQQRPFTPPSPAAPPSILQTLDTNAAKGDAVEGDLHALLPEAQSPEAEAWKQCCQLLCIHPEDHKDAQVRSVKIPGTDNMWVKPSQLWTAYWMLTSRTDRGLCGGVLADVMGTGKTYVCLVVCLLRAFIGYNRAEVEREWQLRDHEAKKGTGSGGKIAPKQHHPRSVSGTENIPCPCGNGMGIECYANPGGITRRIADSLSRGASLILAPQTVIDNWVKTVKHVRLQHKYFEPVVFGGKMTNEEVSMAPAPRLKQKLQMSVRPQLHVSSDGLFPQTWQPNVLDVVHEYQPGISKDAYPERFIFLATHMPEKLTEFFQLPVPVRRRAGAGARERKTVYGCPIGIQLVDEFHKAKDAVIALALQHKHLQSSNSTDNFDFWAITGTPLPAKLTDLETVTDILQRLPQWDDEASPHHGSRVVALRELQVAYEKAVAEDGTPEQAADFRSRAERFFQGGIVKRHTESSMFFGQRIFNLQDVAPRVVVHKTPEPLRDDVSRVVARVAVNIRESMTTDPASTSTNWEQAVRSSSLFNHMMDLEILATFPGAARLMLADPPVFDFGLAAIRAEIRKAEDRDVTKVALFQKHLNTVIEGSPHLQAILETIDEMGRDKQKRRALPTPVAADASNKSVLSKKKLDLGVKKLVVLCPRMGEAVFVYLALRKLRPDVSPVFLHADLKLSERTALLQDFNRLDAPTPAGINHTARVLVGTFRDAGTGNDLTVANYQILTGPLRLRSQQDQAFGRTNREGQTLRLHHRLLVAEDSPVDRIIMVTQARRHISSDPFAMDEELELAPVEEEGGAGGEQ